MVALTAIGSIVMKTVGVQILYSLHGTVGWFMLGGVCFQMLLGALKAILLHEMCSGMPRGVPQPD